MAGRPTFLDGGIKNYSSSFPIIFPKKKYVQYFGVRG